MFLRAPKHFKVGKQFIFNRYTTICSVYTVWVKNTYTFVGYNSVKLFKLLNSLFIKNLLPELKINKITVKFKISVKLMAGVLYLNIIVSAIIFSFIFWGLTFLAKYTYSNKYFNYKVNFYECGFKNLTKKKITYDINYILLLLFLLIYDGEFLLLIPFSFNSFFISFTVICCLSFFLIWLLIALIFDYAYGALDWQNSC